MSAHSLVFKLYGDFLWPPKSALDATGPRRLGCVQIHYARATNTNSPLRAFLVWKPWAENPQATVLSLDDAPSLSALDIPHDWFADENNAHKPIWIDGPVLKPEAPPVIFRGAFLFEQYSLTDPDNRRELRWPLVPEYHNNITTLYSFLSLKNILSDQHQLYPRFDFGLSLPLPIKHADNQQWAAFPLRAAYAPKAKTLADTGTFTALVGCGFDAQGKPVEFMFDNFPSERLGNFCLAAVGVQTADCAVYEQQSNTSKLQNYWPADSSIVREVLQKAGLQPTLSNSINQTPADAHLRFASPSNGQGCTLTYRAQARKVTLGSLRDYEAPLALADVLHVDINLEWSIADADVWLLERWKPVVSFRLIWSETFSSDVFSQPLPSTFAKRLLAETAARAYGTRIGLPFIEGLQPVSILPALKLAKERRLAFVLCSGSLDATCAERQNEFCLSWGSALAVHVRMTLADSQTIPPMLREDVVPSTNRLLLQASLPSFLGDTELGLSLGADEDWAIQEANSGEAGSPYFASFALRVTAIAKTSQARIGSLAFKIPAQPGELEVDPGFLRTAGRPLGGPHAWRYGAGQLNASLHLTLPVSQVTPLSTDVARNDRSRRPAPLLIDIFQSEVPPVAAPAQEQANYYLRATETFGSDEDRLLTLSLLDNAQASGDRDYLLLAEEPYSVLRFRQTQLGARGNAGNTEVALYSSDDRLWQYRSVSPLYHFMLPPQAIGESTDKPHRLELHDLKTQDATVPRPYMGSSDAQGKVLQYRAVEWHLTPSTDLWVQPSDVARGYFIPEQASYELFRQRGEYGLGVALAGMRSEFLYGLSVSVEVAGERSVARFARVAEISSLTGSIVGTPREKGSDPQISERWSKLARAIARRPERLELWARDPDSPVDFAPARFAEGTRFALRNTALHRAPLALAETTDTSVPEALPGQLRFHRHGLSGGALWPIESLNLLTALKNLPTSQGGTLEQVALAPFGGDAAQKAEFLNGIVKIVSETRNGFVERQKVEVMGRVGALWHRAKYVVVYERTVNPSAQFAPPYADDLERSRSRRPILRKVREYIELLQSERLYPDFPQAMARSAGFLDRVRFNSRIINVDSAWGSEVGTFGWQIPLWNCAAAEQRPQVYAMPDVAFVTVAEGDGDNPLVAQECLDTDLLFFFADFKAGTSDTDLWQARLDVDYANLPLAKTIAQAVDQNSSARPASSDTTSSRRPAVSRVLPGARRFTWRLAPAARKTAINAGRAQTPIYVGLESVSFMRAAFMPKGEQIFGPLSQLLTSSGAVDRIDDLALWQPGQTSTLSGVNTGPFLELTQQLLAAPDKDTFKAVYEQLDTIWAAPDANLVVHLSAALASKAQQLSQAITAADGGLLGSIDKVGKRLAAGEPGCQKLKTNAVGLLRRKALLVHSVLQGWQADLNQLIDQMPKDENSKTLLVECLISNLIVCLKPLFKEASDDIGNVQEGAAKARTILLSVGVEVQDLFARANVRLDQLMTAYDRDKPWSAQRRQAFRADYHSALSSLADDIRGATDEARQRLSSELGDFAQSIANHLGRALSLLGSQEAAALRGLGALSAAVSSELHSVDQSVAALAQEQLTLLLQAIDRARHLVEESDLGKVPTPPRDQASEQTLKDAVLGALQVFKSTVEQALQSHVEQVLKTRLSVDDYRGDLVEPLAQIVAKLKEQIRQMIEGLQAANADLVGNAEKLKNAGFSALSAALTDCWLPVKASALNIKDWLDQGYEQLQGHLDTLDFYVDHLSAWMHGALPPLLERINALNAGIDEVAADLVAALDPLKAALAPAGLLSNVVVDQVLRPTLKTLLAPLPETLDVPKQRAEIQRALAQFADPVKQQLEQLDQQALAALGPISQICEQLYGDLDQAAKSLRELATQQQEYFDKALNQFKSELKDAYDNGQAELDKMLKAARAFDRSVRNLQNDLSRTVETAQMYGNRVLAASGRLGEGDLMATPSNVLKLYSAVTSAPELAGLKSDIERIRAGFDDLSDVIDITEAGALFNRLGDELKALGISFPYDRISDRLLPADLAGMDLGELFRNIGGANLVKLFKGEKLSDSVRDAIRLTHAFDRQRARAWVQVDIDAPLPGRHCLFSIGPFQCNLVDMHLLGQMRLETSKDQDKLTQSGFGRIAATLDMVVSGQSMVSFDKFALNFSQEKGLKIDFDPNNIRLNPAFQFVQDALLGLFPDMVGPLTVIKKDGIPIGLEHQYALPVISANAITSGISNISIENRLRLIAYPDFVLSDLFSLSRPERPFIFSLFILGGTGFVQIEAEYRPFDGELTVTVDAAAGASALLGISAGPFSGQVFITLSAVLSYRKTLGQPGGGLAVSALLVIAGYVDVMGIATVGIYVALRLAYRDNGQVDADGTLSVTIKISRFFSITARASVQYRLRNGHAQTRTTSGIEAAPGAELQNITDKAEKAVKKIQGATI